jgi:hypothetical protein
MRCTRPEGGWFAEALPDESGFGPPRQTRTAEVGGRAVAELVQPQAVSVVGEQDAGAIPAAAAAWREAKVTG